MDILNDQTCFQPVNTCHYSYHLNNLRVMINVNGLGSDERSPQEAQVGYS